PRALPGFFRDPAARALLKTAIWVGSCLAGWWSLRAVNRPGDPPGDTAQYVSWRSIWCAAVVMMTAFTFAWRVDGEPPLTPGTSAVDLYRHASAFMSVAYDFGAHRLEAPDVLL